MEYGNTRRITNQPNLISAKPQDSFRQFSQARLATLISINKETAYENSLYNSTKEIEEETLLKNPLSVESAFSYFGLLIGTITPTAIFTRFSLEVRIFHGDDLWILGIFAIVNLITAIVGFVRHHDNRGVPLHCIQSVGDRSTEAMRTGVLHHCQSRDAPGK